MVDSCSTRPFKTRIHDQKSNGNDQCNSVYIHSLHFEREGCIKSEKLEDFKRRDFLKLTYIKVENEDVFIEKKIHYAHMSHIVKVHACDLII